jgi:hypothetical protein
MTLTRVGKGWHGAELWRKAGNVSAVANCGTKVEERLLTPITKRCYIYLELFLIYHAAIRTLVAAY